MLVQENTPVADTELPVERLKDHLRLASGFAEDHIQDALLAGFLRAAMVTIEGRISRKLLQRGFSVELTEWPAAGGCALPLSPVVQLLAVQSVDQTGDVQDLPVGTVRITRTAERFRLEGQPFAHVPPGGAIRLSFLVGMSSSFEGLPADLAQAVMLLAAHYYEYRTQTQLGSGCMPFGVTALIDQYRPIRLGLGQTS